MERHDGDAVVWNARCFRDQFEHLGNFFPVLSAHGFAGVDKDCYFESCKLRESKALKISDDNIFVNHCKITRVQGCDGVVVLIGSRKSDAYFGDICTVDRFGSFAGRAKSTELAHD